MRRAIDRLPLTESYTVTRQMSIGHSSCHFCRLLYGTTVSLGLINEFTPGQSACRKIRKPTRHRELFRRFPDQLSNRELSFANSLLSIIWDPQRDFRLRLSKQTPEDGRTRVPQTTKPTCFQIGPSIDNRYRQSTMSSTPNEIRTRVPSLKSPVGSKMPQCYQGFSQLTNRSLLAPVSRQSHS